MTASVVRRSVSMLAIAALALAGCPGTDPDPEPEPEPCVPSAENLCPDPAVITPNESGWWRDDVFYEVFVRSFHDSNGDGKGDLRGLTAKLDYLNDGNPATTTDLGIDGIWLMPIFSSPSYHGYDVTDYRNVDSDYGTLEDFDALIAAAHARGIKVILDMVVNHTSSSHPWFMSAKATVDSEKRDFYVWRDALPSPLWKRPWDGSTLIWHRTTTGYYYGIYWSEMPDLNWKNPAVEAEMLDVMRFWLARGVDGFRVDAARFLVESDDGKVADRPETHEAFQRLRHAIHQQYPQAMMVAEAWTAAPTVATYYGEGNEFQLAFNFDVAKGILESLNAGTRSSVNTANYQASSSFRDRGFEAPFLSNHDQPRAMRELGDSLPKAKVAAALLLAHPGTPFLYYGEEIGMQGGPQTRDEDKRTPMRWDATSPTFGFSSASTTWYTQLTGATVSETPGVDVESARADANSLWNVYRDLIALRRSSPALSKGDTTRPAITGGTDALFALLRTGAGGERVLLVTNLGTTTSGAFTVAVSGTPLILESEGEITPPVSASGALSFTDLPAQSFAFIQLD